MLCSAARQTPDSSHPCAHANHLVDQLIIHNAAADAPRQLRAGSHGAKDDSLIRVVDSHPPTTAVATATHSSRGGRQARPQRAARSRTSTEMVRCRQSFVSIGPGSSSVLRRRRSAAGRHAPRAGAEAPGVGMARRCAREMCELAPAGARRDRGDEQGLPDGSRKITWRRRGRRDRYALTRARGATTHPLRRRRSRSSQRTSSTCSTGRSTSTRGWRTWRARTGRSGASPSSRSATCGG